MAKQLVGTAKFQVPGGQATPPLQLVPRWVSSVSTSVSSCSSSMTARRSASRECQSQLLSMCTTIVRSISSPKALQLRLFSRKLLALLWDPAFQTRHKVGKVNKDQIEKIVKPKIADLNARDVEHAKRMIEGTARSMGLVVEG